MLKDLWGNSYYSGRSSRVCFRPLIIFSLYKWNAQMYRTEHGSLCWCSTAYAVGDSLESILTSVNLELERVSSWLCTNKLSLNYGKYLFTNFSSKTLTCYPQLLMRRRLVRFDNKTKNFSFMIDNKLNFSDHIGEVCTKICRFVGVMKIKTFLCYIKNCLTIIVV